MCKEKLHGGEKRVIKEYKGATEWFLRKLNFKNNKRSLNLINKGANK